MNTVNHSWDILFIIKVGEFKPESVWQSHNSQCFQEVIDIVRMAEFQFFTLVIEYGHDEDQCIKYMCLTYIKDLFDYSISEPSSQFGQDDTISHAFFQLNDWIDCFL